VPRDAWVYREIKSVVLPNVSWLTNLRIGTRPAKQYRDEGALKAACPECGAVTELTDFAKVMAFVCDHCGAGVDVEGEPEPDS
jgi:hypothetical protein